MCICIFLYLGTYVQPLGSNSDFLFHIMVICVFVFTASKYFCICVFVYLAGHICEVVQLGGSSWHAAELATAVPRETAGEAEGASWQPPQIHIPPNT